MLDVALSIVASIALLESSSFAKDGMYATDRVHNLRTIATTLHIDLIDTAPTSLFRSGPCVIVGGTFIPSPRPDRRRIRNFRLERRIVEPKTIGNTKRRWTEVSVKSAIAVLEHVAFVDDPIAKRHREPVFTMPLPALREGKWTIVNAACGQSDLLKKYTNAKLFRFVDFTASPENTYEYRVQLMLLEKDERQATPRPFSKPSVPVDACPANQQK